MGNSKLPHNGLNKGKSTKAFTNKTKVRNREQTANRSALKARKTTLKILTIPRPSSHGDRIVAAATKSIDEQFVAAEASTRRGKGSTDSVRSRRIAVDRPNDTSPRLNLDERLAAEGLPSPKKSKAVPPLLMAGSKARPFSAAELLTNPAPAKKHIPSGSFYGKSRPQRDASGWATVRHKGNSFSSRFNRSKQQQRLLFDYSSQSQSSRPKDSIGGFRNVGNTCYLNATLQALLVIEPFVAALRKLAPVAERAINSSQESVLVLDDNGDVKENNDGQQHAQPTVLISMVNLIEKLDQKASQRDVIDPSEVKRRLAKTVSSFEGWGQQDAHEFLTFLLDQLHQETSHGNADEALGPLPDTFKCVIKHTRTCQQCQQCTTMFENFLELSVELPDELKDDVPSLETLLKQSFQRETVEYKCEHCQHDVSTFSHEIVSLPRCLIVTLKRFSFDLATQQRSKTRNPVNVLKDLSLEGLVSADVEAPKPFESKLAAGTLKRALFEEKAEEDDNDMLRKAQEESLLSLSPAQVEQLDEKTQLRYALLTSKAESPSSAPTASSRSTDDETPDRIARKTGPLDYRLMAVTRHSGTATGGHYICDAFDLASGKWRTFDDSVVRPRDWSSVKSRAERDGYLLFYVHNSVLP
eukprot:TRINITY_DN11819_c4_g5_i1.p1 TRINITY_DN11819_c4_g5~~TRINITY_DN11819_c4_g5_i1.p1  ORF type:complete len:640 (+),score=159.23 TRINITY_DN11819_c4_g5_i1:30-1949(+)